MRILKFTKDQIASIESMDDFYTSVGAYDYINDPAGDVEDITQMFINDEECRDLRLLMQNNLSICDSKNLQIARMAIDFDWANNSPVGYDGVPCGELWICTKEEAKGIRERMRTGSKIKKEKRLHHE